MPERFERDSRASPAVAADELTFKVTGAPRIPAHRYLATATLFEFVTQRAHVDFVLFLRRRRREAGGIVVVVVVAEPVISPSTTMTKKAFLVDIVVCRVVLVPAHLGRRREARVGLARGRTASPAIVLGPILGRDRSAPIRSEIVRRVEVMRRPFGKVRATRRRVRVATRVGYGGG